MNSLSHSIRYLFSFTLLLVLASIPLAFSKFIGPYMQEMIFQPQMVPRVIKEFLFGIYSTEAFFYSSGSDMRFFPADMVDHFVSSFLYLISSGCIVIILSFVFGIWLWKVSNRYLNAILNFLGMIPDFILILLLQLTVSTIYKNTGVKIAKVASLSLSEPAILLPMITFVIPPLVYLIRTLNIKTYEVATEDYIQTAIAKGLNKHQIYFHYVTTNVIPFFKADLHKMTSIMISNLFIVEYLFNIKGVTTMLFQHQVNFGYQYNVVVLCLISLVFLYMLVSFSFRLLIVVVERIIKYA